MKTFVVQCTKFVKFCLALLISHIWSFCTGTRDALGKDQSQKMSIALQYNLRFLFMLTMFGGNIVNHIFLFLERQNCNLTWYYSALPIQPAFLCGGNGRFGQSINLVKSQLVQLTSFISVSLKVPLPFPSIKV